MIASTELTTASAGTDTPVDCSIVVPVYFNEGSLQKTFQLLQEVVFSKNSHLNFEVIFVDDGSGDGSLAELMALNAQHTGVKVIKLSRNFGQVAAILAGYRYAAGKAIITISADLQDPPQLINDMLDRFFKENANIVICTRQSREESFFRRKTSNLFYSIIRRISFPTMPEGGFDFFLISAKVKHLLMTSNEKNPFLQGQILWTGFNVTFIPYVRTKREVGHSRWTLGKKIKYLIDGMLAYSYLPLRFMSVLGMLISGCGFLYAAIIFFLKLFGGIPILGWAPIMILILVLSGFQMLMLGIIGEYLWRTLDQVRNRQLYVVEEVFEKKE